MTDGLATRCIHAGEIDDAHGSPHTPIYTTTTFKFASTADLLDVVDGRKPGSLYTRYGLNLGSVVSCFFTVDTRFSVWSGYGFSPLFTVDTRLPLLTLEKAGTNFVFSWFAATAGYQLEVSTNLTNPNWSPVTNIPILSGLQRSVTNPFTGPNQFYRLRKN